MVYCVFSLILPRRADFNENTQHTFLLKKIEKISRFCLNLALWSRLISSNYPCPEHIFMVPKGFEPFKFYCLYIVIIVKYNHENDMHAVCLRFSTLKGFKTHLCRKNGSMVHLALLLETIVVIMATLQLYKDFSLRAYFR